MAKGIWRRQGNVAVPVGATSMEFLQGVKEGAEFIAETRGARNVRQLNMWWALCELVAENDADYETREKASDGLKLALKHVDTFLDRTGRLHIWPKSIAFESLTQESSTRCSRLRSTRWPSGWGTRRRKSKIAS
jgi:hypothetical protein